MPGHSTSTIGGGSLTDLMKKWETTQEGARLSNIERSEQITAIYDEIIRRYEPGGTFGKAALGQLEKQKVRDVGGEMQQMISSGIYGTTTAAGGGRRWEESVGQPARLRLEDIMMQRLSQAQVGKAGFMERIEEPYPDYGAMMGAMQQAAAAPTGGMSISGTTGGTQKWGSYGTPAQAAPAPTRIASFGPTTQPATTGGYTGTPYDPTSWVATGQKFTTPTGGGVTGGYTPQTGDYMSVMEGPGGAIKQGGISEVYSLKTERGPGGVYALGARTTYTEEQAAWLAQQSKKISAAQSRTV